MPGLLRGIARTAVIAGTATAVSNRVSRRQAGRWADQDQQDQQGQDAQQQPEPRPAAAVAVATPAPADAGDGMDLKLKQLKELGDLKAQGILTEAEFAAQKQQILGG